MNRSELRALRLRIIDGKALTQDESLSVVSALEELADVAVRNFGPPGKFRHPRPCANDCPHTDAACAMFEVFRKLNNDPGMG